MGCVFGVLVKKIWSHSSELWLHSLLQITFAHTHVPGTLPGLGHKKCVKYFPPSLRDLAGTEQWVIHGRGASSCIYRSTCSWDPKEAVCGAPRPRQVVWQGISLPKLWWRGEAQEPSEDSRRTLLKGFGERDSSLLWLWKRFGRIFFFFCRFGATLSTYGCSQARGQVRTVAAGLHHGSQQR